MTMSKFFEGLYLTKGCDYTENLLEKVVEMYNNNEKKLNVWMKKNNINKIDNNWVWDYVQD